MIKIGVFPVSALFTCLLYASGAQASEIYNIVTEVVNEHALIKTFNDICYNNKENISKLPRLANKLGWEKSKDEELFGIKKYRYKNYTVMIKSDMEEVFCSVGSENRNKEYGYKLAEMMKSKYKPISKVLNTREYYADKGIPWTGKKDIETNYIQSWITDGGFRVTVALADYSYQGIKTSSKKIVSLQLSRF